jgi:hypothetical protein
LASLRSLAGKGGGDGPAPFSFARRTLPWIVSAATALFLTAACARPRLGEVAPAPASGTVSPVSPPISAVRLDGEAVGALDELEHRTFEYFWDLANPENGLVPDRAPSPSFSSIAAVGFALTVYPIGAERGWVTREAARDRVLTTLRFFAAPSGGAAGGHGFYYHFLDMKTGARFKDVELSTIDSAIVFAGALFCQSYFDRDDTADREIRSLADRLYRAADWSFWLKRPPLVSMGWTPEGGFNDWDWHGLNEGMILYVLAVGSPTHAIPPEAWQRYTSTYKWQEFEGQTYVQFAPLFGHQYSQIWIDARGIRDAYMRAKGIDYFENSRRATYAHRAYAIANPNGWKDYGADTWGLSACDGPVDGDFVVDGRRRHFYTYAARGASAVEVRDDGTIAPTAAASSLPFAPEIVMPAIREMLRRDGGSLLARYGFVDAFNPTFRLEVPVHHGRVVAGAGWQDTDSLGIDQGPIVAMIENARTELVWKTLKKNPYVTSGLRRAGFTGGWLDAAPR